MTHATFPYTSAAAFRAALKDRFTDIAKTQARYTVGELQRQFAYDRVLARIFSSDDAERWVLKGAGALLARLEQARHSKDIDVYFTEQQAEAAEAVASLRSALVRDLDDFSLPRRRPPRRQALRHRRHEPPRVWCAPGYV